MKIPGCHLLFLALLLVLLSGCSSMRDHEPAPGRIDLSDHKLVRQLLDAQYKEWKGVHYRMGGLSKSGIDCSGFVYVTYRERFGIRLPRETDAQAEMGHKIARRNLMPGDLVFFKTGIAKNHVGIYLRDGAFLHASTTGGVMISRLDDKYWSKAYWKSMRLYA
ncbi:MAG TPA: NlpC/P60 family protein [Pseudomonadales bacterium]|nr:NlpC/P60 family protein [Pseudomonadales bacterium]